MNLRVSVDFMPLSASYCSGVWRRGGEGDDNSAGGQDRDGYLHIMRTSFNNINVISGRVPSLMFTTP